MFVACGTFFLQLITQGHFTPVSQLTDLPLQLLPFNVTTHSQGVIVPFSICGVAGIEPGDGT
jgi:hypothetical protein